jgi:outer membrane protein assembly factor BamB
VCVVGDRLFTQEQLDQEELVTCYRVADGKPLWKYAEKDRYSDQMSGAGPRATPTFHNGKVYAMSARGILNCLDAATGTKVWGVDLKETHKAEVPPFGVSCSPLIVDGKVIVCPASGSKEKPCPRLVAFDAQSGSEVWSAPDGTVSYSSPQLSVVAGVPQVLIHNSDGLFAHDPATGAELWHFALKPDPTVPAVTQPMVLPGDKVVIGGGRIGIVSHCAQVTHTDGEWKAEEAWKTKFTPAFNDFVYQGGFLYGLDSGRMTCLDAATGKERWKDGNYGTGQLLLVGDRILVQADDGHLALVKATPDGWEEVATHDALSKKTWNHPVIANGRLFVRNGHDIICFALPGAPR